MFLRSCLVIERMKSLLTPKSFNKIVKVNAHIDPCKIGMREVVGMGAGGQATYEDRPDFPCPAIRFYPDDPYLKALREKEKGDWRSLTIDEKKCLYRASFCQTFSEFTASNGEWKSIIGWTFMFMSIGVWFYMFILKFVHSDWPESFSLEHRQAQLKRMIDLRIEPITGLTSKYKYDTIKKEDDEEE